MAECRAALESAGFTGIETHIQTGNVRVQTSMRSLAKVEQKLDEVFTTDRGFEVETIVFKPADLAQLASDADEVLAEFGREPHAHYLELLREPLDDESVVHEWADDDTHCVVRGRAVHLLLDRPFHEVRGPTVALKRAYGVSTNRNAKVIRAIAGKWC